MFIKYNPKYPHTKIIPLIAKGKTFHNNSVLLRPGTNELKEEEWEAIKPHIKNLLGKEIVPFTVPVKEGASGRVNKAKSLKDVPVATARKIVQECQDPKTLQKWFNQELPDELVLVVAKRMRQMKVEPEDLKDEDTDGTLKDTDITPEDDTGTVTDPRVKKKNDTTDTTEVEPDDLKDEEDVTDDEDEDTEDDTTEDGDELINLDDDVVPDFDGSRSEGTE